MSKIPDLSREQKSELIMELIAYAITRDRIWNYDKPCTALARLCAAIYMGNRITTSETTYLTQELRKVPDLWDKVKPYFERP